MRCVQGAYGDGEVVWVRYGKMGFPWPAKVTTKVESPKVCRLHSTMRPLPVSSPRGIFHAIACGSHTAPPSFSWPSLSLRDVNVAEPRRTVMCAPLFACCRAVSNIIVASTPGLLSRKSYPAPLLPTHGPSSENTQGESTEVRDTGVLVTWFGKKQSVSFVSASAIAGRWGESDHDARCKASKSIAFVQAVQEASEYAGAANGDAILPVLVKTEDSDVAMSPRKRYARALPRISIFDIFWWGERDAQSAAIE